MAHTELPWLIAGRLVRPYALAVSLACLTLGALIITGQSRYGSGMWSGTLAVVAIAASVILWVGWWHSGLVGDALMRHGLLLSAGVFAARGAFMVLSGEPIAGAFVACWAVASGGAYLLEATSGDDQRTAWTSRNGAGGGGSE